VRLHEESGELNGDLDQVCIGLLCYVGCLGVEVLVLRVIQIQALSRYILVLVIV
jgi:hypothetical protein